MDDVLDDHAHDLPNFSFHVTVTVGQSEIERALQESKTSVHCDEHSASRCLQNSARATKTNRTTLLWCLWLF